MIATSAEVDYWLTGTSSGNTVCLADPADTWQDDTCDEGGDTCANVVSTDDAECADDGEDEE